MKNLCYLILPTVLLLLLGCSDERQVERDLSQDCLNHYRAESYLVASSTCQKAADYGILRAQWLLGHIYYFDLAKRGSTKEQAFEWYLKAAKGGWPEAQTFVGESYMYADGVAEDFEKAYSWLSKAVQHYDPNAEFAIGMLFYNGNGRAKDLSSALSWFKKAASKEHIMSINNLAWIYATSSQKAFRNPKKALFWANKLRSKSQGKPLFLDTRAAAHALAEEFDVAIALQNEAISLLPKDIADNRLVEFEQRLVSYQNNQSWHEND